MTSTLAEPVNMTDLVTVRVPDAKMMEHVATLTRGLTVAMTIPDVRKVIALAEALSAATKAMHASAELQREANTLVVRCERRLGEITSQIVRRDPRNFAGGQIEDGPFKHQVLAAQGISRARAVKAEFLARSPPAKFEAAIRACEKVTKHKVLVKLGSRSEGNRDQLRTKWRHEMYRFARETVDFVASLVTANRVPTIEELGKLRRDLSHVRERIPR